MRIGQLAAQTGFSVRTIRFYEQSGLLPTPQRTSAGYRCYEAYSRPVWMIFDVGVSQ